MHTIGELKELIKSVNYITFKTNYNDIKKIGLYPGQPEILKELAEHEGISVRELSRITKKEPATITKSLQRLEASGYVIKKTDANDKRIVKIYITEVGKEALEGINKMVKKQLDMYKKILTGEEINNLYDILHKIKSGLEGEYNERNI